MSSAFEISSRGRSVIENRTEMLGGKKAVPAWQKPLFVALIVIGIIGFGAAGTGLASLGAQHGWWAAGGLTNLNQIQAIIMMSVGGGGGALFLTAGIIGIIRMRPKIRKHEDPKIRKHEDLIPDKTDLTKVDTMLGDKTWTFVRQEDGKYTLVMKHPPKQGQIKGEIEELRNDLTLEQLHEAAQGPNSYFYNYIKTSPDNPTDMLIHEDVLDTRLGVNTFTFVLQVNGNYSLVVKQVGFANRIAQELKASQVEEEYNNLKQILSFIETSEWPKKN